MIIGIPTETKADEYRVALRPVGAKLLTSEGHQVVVQRGAGKGSGFQDDEYERAGARLIATAAELFRTAELIVKVKEPQPDEIKLLRPEHVVFGYFHFAGSTELTRACLDAGFSALAYETLYDRTGGLPLLTPMSEIAGRMSIQEGAKYLERPFGGRGVLLGGVPGVAPAEVVILGAGVVGTNAARIAAGMGANVTLLDINLARLRELDNLLPPNVTTLYSDPHAIDANLQRADLVIGAVLIPGQRAPCLVRRHHLPTMKPGAVAVDVSIDQGGCFETSRPTSHATPTYVIDDVVHYCVTNMPGAVSHTSTAALCNATLPYVRDLARLGVDEFTRQSPGHGAALNLRAGQIVNPDVSEAFRSRSAPP